jgi:hypothetical protein
VKFQVTIKDPDVFADAAREAVEEQVNAIDGLLDDDIPDIVDRRTEKVMEALGKWVEYSEYIVVEFDTDAMTATVIPRH